jgi:hypothetical protein
MPDEELHLADHARSQAHTPTLSRRRSMLATGRDVHAGRLQRFVIFSMGYHLRVSP